MIELENDAFWGRLGLFKRFVRPQLLRTFHLVCFLPSHDYHCTTYCQWKLVVSEDVLDQFDSEGIRDTPLCPLKSSLLLLLMQHALLGAGTTDAKMGECYSCRFKYGVVTVSQSSSPHSRLVQQAEDTAVDFVHNLKPLRLYFKATGFLHIAGLGCAKGGKTPTSCLCPYPLWIYVMKEWVPSIQDSIIHRRCPEQLHTFRMLNRLAYC